MEFLLAEDTANTLSPLPILGTSKNVTRVDPEEPITSTGIYRDIWERKPLADDEWDARLKDVCSSLDYPLHGDFVAAQDRAYDRKEARDYPRE